MKEKIIKDVMIPISDYVTVPEDETLECAIKALKEAQTNTNLRRKHRAVLAFDENKNITGKVSLRCLFRALEPKYRQFENPENVSSIGLSRFGFSDDFLSSLFERYSLWDETLEELVNKAKKLKIKDVMYKPENLEFVDIEAPVAEAVHQFILGCHQSLLVSEKGKVVGLIRLVDLFDLVADLI